MKVAICMLSYGRHHLTAQVLKHNLANHGLGHDEVGLFVADTLGIAKATNEVLRRAYEQGYDYFCVCGNDIIELDKWLLRRVNFHKQYRNIGMVAIPVDSIRYLDSQEMVIGNWMVNREVLEKVGAMDESFDPYGPIDLDYNKRCNAFGYQNWYIGGAVAHHIHEHSGEELYGFNKIEQVNKTWQQHVDGHAGHIPLIEMQQMYDGQTEGN